MSSRFNFNGLSTCHNLSSQGLALNDKLAPNTTDGLEMCDEHEVQPLYNPSLQNLTNAYEISFEKDIISEHSAVFKREFSNYMEFVRTYLSNTHPKLLNRFPEGLYDMNTNMTCQELMMMTQTDMSHDTKRWFTDQFKRYDKLMQFLDIVADYCPSQMAIELVHIAQQILEEFTQSQYRDDNFVDCQTLLQLAYSKASKLQSIKMLNLSILGEKLAPELMGKYEKFIDIYCSTTMLVITQYFDNPFFRQSEFDGLKRTLSPFYLEDDEEENGSTKPRKLRKFSF